MQSFMVASTFRTDQGDRRVAGLSFLNVLQRARTDGDGMRRPPGHLITVAEREEVLGGRRGGEKRALHV